MSEKKRKNQKKQWIIGFCGLLVIGAVGGMLAAKMTAVPSDTEKTTKDTAGQDSEEDDSLDSRNLPRFFSSQLLRML